MKQTFIGVSPRDRVLITAAPSLDLVGYRGEFTSASPDSFWLKFSFSKELRGVVCALAPAQLPNGVLTKVPERVQIVQRDGAEREIMCRRDGDEAADDRRYRIGRFPRGDIQELRLPISDGARLTVRDEGRQGRFPDQALLKFVTEGAVFVYARQVLRSLLKGQSEQ